MATLFRTQALIAPQQPRLLAAPVEYSPQYQEQYSNTLRLYFNQLQNFNQLLTTNTGGALLRFPNGAWYQHSESQTIGQINKGIPICMSNATSENAITLNDSVATFTGVKAGTTLTVSSWTGAPIALNMRVIGSGWEDAVFTGYIDDGLTEGVPGNVLHVTAVTSGTITDSMYITGVGITAGTQISVGGTGTGGVGTYYLSDVIDQTVPAGTAINGYNRKIVSYGTGTGGNGTYTVSGAAGAIASTNLSARAKDRVDFTTAGYYNFQFSAQVSKSSGGAAYVWIWPRINGADMPDSNTKLAIQGTTSEVVAAWNFVFPVATGDYFQLMMASNSTNVVLLDEAANAFSPAIPAFILTVTFVSAIFA